ncbi:MAG: IS1595 family transposase [Pyrinomonadaceae bacterium]
MLENLPKTLVGVARYFADPQVCIDFVAFLRWENGEPVCVHCKEKGAYFLASRKIYKCKKCRKQFSVKMGTIFAESAVGLDKWLVAIWLIANCKNGISSYELARDIDVTQRTAWFMNHRIRTAMTVGSIEKMGGGEPIEMDETFIGGNAKNMHRAKRERFLPRYSSKNRVTAHKTAVFGMVQRGGKVKAQVIKSVRTKDVMPIIQENIEKNAEVFTDSAPIYRDLWQEYIHESVNHSVEYVRGNVHTNSIENFWSLLKRTIKGTYVSVSPAHLQKYVEEQMFRYNEREGDDAFRFVRMLESISGKRLTYNELIDYEIRG